MSDVLRLTILGCSSSPGVPRITGDWGACDPSNPRNRRRRASALLQRISSAGTTTVVYDCGPDFREQMLDAQVARIDAVLLTHPHADHIHGLDDLRGFMQERGGRIAVHADASTYARALEAFRYCFHRPENSDYPPIAVHKSMEEYIPVRIDGPGGALEILPIRQIHGSITSLGFRCGPIVYASDVSDFPERAIAAIAGARHIVIDALQYKTHPSHLSLDQSLGWIERFGVAEATLTHMHTPLDYATLCKNLPSHIRPAYDGLQIEFPID